jgi:hypothetical protein
MPDVLQRYDWHGFPLELGDVFVLTKNKRKARCLLLSHQFGREVRLLVASQLEILQSQVYRTRTKY